MTTIPKSASRRQFLSRSAYGALGLTTGVCAITSLTAERTEGARLDPWPRFTRTLALALVELDADEFLTLVRRDTNRFVQFYRDTWGLRAESVSNTFLDGAARLPRGSRQALAAAGWKAPGRPEGHREPQFASPNYYLDFRNPVAFDDAAALGVWTLREIHGVSELEVLTYTASYSSEDSLLPTLGIAQAEEGL